MRVQEFWLHHGVERNPYDQEDAQTDQVFKQHCLNGTHHPAWDKIFGHAGDPSTAVVFGEKGAGKTALRLQMVDEIDKHNANHPNERTFVVEYDDFNPFLDRFRDRLWGSARKPERALSYWRLWDHMDAILSLAVTRLIDLILRDRPDTTTGSSVILPERLASLSRLQQRDLLQLGIFYDRSSSMPKTERWSALRKRLKFSNLMAGWDLAVGLGVTLLLVIGLISAGGISQFQSYWPWIVMLVAWAPYLLRNAWLLGLAWRVKHQMRVVDHDLLTLRKLLATFERKELIDQPIPARDRSDDRYESFQKLQSILKSLGFTGILVVVDRVDEPHLINGSAERMRDLLWPMFDNKFLKHPGIGFKLLLPIEVSWFLAKADREFYERSRLDKQNLIRSLHWTGESLYDVALARFKACDKSGKGGFRGMFDPAISDSELISSFERLRVPRHMFKFMHRLVVEHCNRYTDENPRWNITRETLQSVLAIYTRELQEFDRGIGTV